MARTRTEPSQLVVRWLILVGLLTMAAASIVMDVTSSWRSVSGWSAFGIGAIVAVVCAARSRQWLRRVFGRRRALVGLNVALMTVFASLILVGANYLSVRHMPLALTRRDVTSAKSHRLSSKTLNVIQGLKEDVKIRSLFSAPEVAAQLQDFRFVTEAKDMLEEYRLSSKRVSYENIDTVRNPRAAWDLLIWTELPKALKAADLPGDAASLVRQAAERSELTPIQALRLLKSVEGDSLDVSPEELATIAAVRGLHPVSADAFLAALKQRQSIAENAKRFLEAVRDLEVPKPDLNSVIFICGDRSKHVSPDEMTRADSGNRDDASGPVAKRFAGENAFTAAITEVIEEQQATVYFTTGHGEPELHDYRYGLSETNGLLRKANYETQTINLSQTKRVPDDCAVLVIASPLEPSFSDEELEAVRAYLAPGGSALVMLDPVRPSAEQGDSRLTPLLREWGVEARESVAVINDARGADDFEIKIPTKAYGDHAIVRHLAGAHSVFLLACPVSATGDGTGYQAASLVMSTSAKGWGETDLALLYSEGKAERGEEDVPGPVSIAAAAENEALGSRVVVFGDTNFAIGRLAQFRGNRELLLNSVNWLARKQSYLGIGPAEPGAPAISLTESQERTLFYAAVVAVPALWVAAGLMVLLLRSIRRTGPSARGVVVAALQRRRALAGTNVAATALLASALLAMVCYLSARHYRRSDWTRDQRLTLAPAIKNLVQSLKRPVTIFPIFSRSQAQFSPLYERMMDTIDGLSYHSEQIQVEPLPQDKGELEIFLATHKIQALRDSLAIFDSGEKSDHVGIDDVLLRSEAPPQMAYPMRRPAASYQYGGQKAFAKAIKSVSDDRQTVVYFLQGHGERDPDSDEPEGLGELADLLKRKNYGVRTVRLSEHREVPEDCGLLVIADPASALSDAGTRALERYLESDGALLVMLEPSASSKEECALESLLLEHGVTVNREVAAAELTETMLLERVGEGQFKSHSVLEAGLAVVVAGDGYDRLHPITKDLASRNTVFYTACQVEAREPTSSSLLSGSDKGWGESKFEEADGRIAVATSEKCDDDVDTKGPLAIAAAVPRPPLSSPYAPPMPEEQAQGPRIVCFGDADWASNMLIMKRTNANRELFVNCVKWLTHEAEADSSMLTVADILDWPGFCAKLKAGKDEKSSTPAKGIWSLLSDDARKVIEDGTKGAGLTDERKADVVGALNGLLAQRDLHEKAFAARVAMPYEGRELLARLKKGTPSPSEKEVQRLNRLILEQAFPDEVRKSLAVSATPFFGPTMVELKGTNRSGALFVICVVFIPAVWLVFGSLMRSLRQG